MTDTNNTQQPGGGLQLMSSPNSSGLLNFNQIESGYLSGGNTAQNQLTKDKGTPKYSSSKALDMNVGANNNLYNVTNGSAKQQSSSMMKHRNAVQNSIKSNNRGSNTPMSGGGRKKRISAYEPASDDESVLEFQNMEHLLMKDPPTNNNTNTNANNMLKKTNSNNFTSQQQDAAQPLSNNKTISKSNSQSKFKQNANKNKSANTADKKVNSGFGSKIGLKKEQSKNTTSRKQSGVNQKQHQTKPIAKDQQPQPQQQPQYINGQLVVQNQSIQQKPAAKSTRGGCCGIFCCGYCCSKGAGIDKDKNEEMDLRPEQKLKPDLQDMKSPTNQQYYEDGGGNGDQDLSQIDDQEEMDYDNSLSQSQMQSVVNDQSQQQLSEVLEHEEMDDQYADEMDDLADEERIELDLRSEMIKNPNSGEQSAGGMMMSLKSSTDPMEMKRLNHHNDDDEILITDGNDEADAPNQIIHKNKNTMKHNAVGSGNNQHQLAADDDINGHVDDSYEQDRKMAMLDNNHNRKSQPRLIDDADEDYDANMDGNDDSDLRQQYGSVPDPERRYSNDHFMRIEGPSPENHQLLLPMSNINQNGTNNNSHSQTPTLSHNGNDDVGNGSSGRVSSDGNQRKAKGSSGHMRIAGDDMGDSNIIGGSLEDEDAANINDDSSVQHREEILDDQSDKTVDNDQEQYKMAQAKRMYVIHEVDEDAFSEKSSRRGNNLSKLHANNLTNDKPQSLNNDQLSNHNEYQNSLQALKEEAMDDEDVYGLNNMKHQQTLSMDNDLSSMQINASQDIDPHNTSQQNLQNNAASNSSQKQLNNNNVSPSTFNNNNDYQYSYSDRTANDKNNHNVNNGRSNSIKILEDNNQSDNNLIAKDFQANGNTNKTPTPHNGQKQQQLLMSNNPQQNDEVKSFADYQAAHSKSLINFQQYMEDEEAKQKRISQTPNERNSDEILQKHSNISNINNDNQQQQQNLSDNSSNQVTKTVVAKDEKQQAFFRPQKNQNNKGAGQQVVSPNRPSTESMNQIYEEIVLIDDFTSSNNNQTPFEKNNNNNTIQKKQSQNKVTNYQPKEQQQPQVIIQKLSIDKSKLSQTYYQNFDQFVIANNLNLDDQTQKANIQANLISDNPFDITKGGLLDQNLLDTKEQALKLMSQRQSIKTQQQHDQTQKIKQKALRKEQSRLAKQQCAIKIQKVWKGHVQREEYFDLRDNLRKVKAVRGLFERSYQKYKHGIINGLRDAIRYSKINKDQQEQEMMNNFLQVCAIQIQSNWRGHKYRSNQLPKLRKERRAEECIRAFVKGWKMRKVMQTREIFSMSQNIKDLTKVQEYFVYVEKNDNMLLLNQLRKDRRKAIQSYIDLIDHLYTSGDWIKGYIGNKIIENEDQLDSTMDGLESQLKSPIKDYNLNDNNQQLKELVTTERFLYDDDLERNPYIFESDEFVRQKFLERRQREYMSVDIEYVDQKQGKGDSGKQLSHKRNNLKNVDDDSSRYDENESIRAKTEKKKANNGGKFRDSFDSEFRGSINPKDNQLLPKNKKTFEQMLEDAMTNEKGVGSQSSKKGGKNSGGKEFLKRKEKYDPQKSLRNKKGEINNKNVEKKRIFKSKNRMGSEDSDEEMQDQDDIYSDENQHETRGTFKHFPRKSFIQLENDPLPTNKTILPPSLLQKLYAEQIKIQKFLRTDTGREVGSNPTKYQPLNKNQQVYPAMPLTEEQLQPSLNLLELESIFQVYHGGQDANQFHKSKTIKRDNIKDSKIPTLREKALFYKYYDDQVFDSQLDEVKREFSKQVKMNKKYLYGAQKLY